MRNPLVLNFLLLKALWSYTCSKFWKSYTPPAARIRVKDDAYNMMDEYCTMSDKYYSSRDDTRMRTTLQVLLQEEWSHDGQLRREDREQE